MNREQRNSKKNKTFLNTKIGEEGMETVTIPKEEFELMQQELETLRSNKIYQRLLEFEQNIANGKRFTRKDLGF